MMNVIFHEKPVLLSCRVSTEKPLYEIGRISRFAHGITEDRYVQEGISILKGDVFSVAENLWVDIEVLISERLARQMNRHRHIAIVQKSTRYNDYLHQKEIHFYQPEELDRSLCEKMGDLYLSFMDALSYSNAPMESLNYWLPLLTMTKVHYHINLRTLIHMFQVRSCTQALPEFRKMMSLIREALQNVSLEWTYLMEVYAYPQCMIPGAFHCKNPGLTCNRRKELQELSEHFIPHLQQMGERVSERKRWDELIRLHAL